MDVLISLGAVAVVGLVLEGLRRLGVFGKQTVTEIVENIEDKLGEADMKFFKSIILDAIIAVKQGSKNESLEDTAKKELAVTVAKKFIEMTHLKVDEESIGHMIESQYWWFKNEQKN